MFTVYTRTHEELKSRRVGLKTTYVFGGSAVVLGAINDSITGLYCHEDITLPTAKPQSCRMITHRLQQTIGSSDSQCDCQSCSYLV